MEAQKNGSWSEVAKGTTVGYKRILPLAEAVTTDKVRVRFLDSRGPLTIARVAVY